MLGGCRSGAGVPGAVADAKDTAQALTITTLLVYM